MSIVSIGQFKPKDIFWHLSLNKKSSKKDNSTIHFNFLGFRFFYIT